MGDSNDHGEGDVLELNVSFNENSTYTKLLVAGSIGRII